MTAATEVYRSGPLYLVVRGDVCRVVGARPEPSPPLPTGSALAHLHAADPWEAVPEADRPEDVRAVAAAEWPGA